jgi:hypothetical protein
MINDKGRKFDADDVRRLMNDPSMNKARRACASCGGPRVVRPQSESRRQDGFLASVRYEMLRQGEAPPQEVARWARGILHRRAGAALRREEPGEGILLAADGPCRLVDGGGVICELGLYDWVAVHGRVVFEVRRDPEVSFYWVSWWAFAAPRHAMPIPAPHE